LKIITGYSGDLARKMFLKMETPEVKWGFVKRKEIVEWSFGNIKQNLKFIDYYKCGLE
jgi:hypothetical protein